MKLGRVWRWVALAVAGLLLYAFLLVVFMPAEYLARAVNALNNNVALQRPSGSIWEGSAVLVGKRGAEKRLGQIRWKIHPWRVFTGAFVADVDFSGNGIEGRGTFEARPQRYILQKVTASAPAPMLSQFYPPASLAGLSGRLQLSAETLEIEQNEIHGDAELVWSDAASRLLPVEKIGTYRLQLTGEGKRIALAVSTVQGVLQIAGKGEWRLFDDGMMRLNGSVSPNSPLPALEPMLSAIGPAQMGGARAFNFETRLAPITIPTLNKISAVASVK
jgi:hypothetical protein